MATMSKQDQASPSGARYGTHDDALGRMLLERERNRDGYSLWLGLPTVVALVIIGVLALRVNAIRQAIALLPPKAQGSVAGPLEPNAAPPTALNLERYELVRTNMEAYLAAHPTTHPALASELSQAPLTARLAVLADIAAMRREWLRQLTDAQLDKQRYMQAAAVHGERDRAVNRLLRAPFAPSTTNTTTTQTHDPIDPTTNQP